MLNPVSGSSALLPSVVAKSWKRGNPPQQQTSCYLGTRTVHGWFCGVTFPRRQSQVETQPIGAQWLLTPSSLKLIRSSGSNCGKTDLRDYFMVMENVLKLDCGGWLYKCLNMLRLLGWMGFMVCKRNLKNWFFFFEKLTVSLRLWIFKFGGKKTQITSLHHRPGLPLTPASTLMPTSNRDNSLQNWKTRTGENVALSPVSHGQEHLLCGPHHRLTDCLTCLLALFPSLRWSLVTRADRL